MTRVTFLHLSADIARALSIIDIVPPLPCQYLGGGYPIWCKCNKGDWAFWHLLCIALHSYSLWHHPHSHSKVLFNNAKIAALAICLAAQVSLFEPLVFFVPLCRLKLVLPLFLYFLFLISAAGGVGAVPMPPSLEVGVEWTLSEVGVASLSLEMCVVLPSSLS